MPPHGFNEQPSNQPPRKEIKMNHYTQHADVREINRLLFTRKHGKTLDVVAAVVIGSALALALVQWWSA